MVASFVVKPKMKLLDWIQLDKLSNANLIINPNAIDLLTKYPKKIDWNYLSYNTNDTALQMLEANPKKN